jgi:hypothetical protein
MTNRQPKGTPVGGQFSEGRRPDGSDLDNDFEPTTLADRETLIMETSNSIDELIRAHRQADENGTLTPLDHAKHYEKLSSRYQDIDFQKSMMIEALQKKLADANQNQDSFSQSIRNEILDEALYDDDISEDTQREEVSEVVDLYFNLNDPADIKGLADLRAQEVDYFFDWATENGYSIPRATP